MKARAGSLLYNMCMDIDGNLTFLFHFCTLPLFDLERRAALAINPSAMRNEVANSQAVA